MKVASLSPQFVIESPTAVDEPPEKVTSEGPHLKVVPTEKSAGSDNSGGHLDRETRDGLKRLSRLIQGKKLKTKRVIATYLQVESGRNLLSGVGTQFDRLV